MLCASQPQRSRAELSPAAGGTLRRRGVRRVAAAALVLVLALGAGGPEAAAESGRGRPLPAIPFAFYTQETSLALGGMVVRGFRWAKTPPDARPNSIVAVAFYTLRHQYSVSVAPGLYLRDGLYHARLSGAFEEWPSTFWGVGRDVSDGDEEGFTRRSASLEGTLLRRVRGALRVGPAVDLSFTGITDVEAGGMLDRGTLEESDGGRVAGLGLAACWDSRDREFWPAEGAYHSLKVLRYLGDPLGDFPFTQATLDLRAFLPLGGGRVLAVQALGVVTDGGAPFFRLARLGGPMNMRGLYQGRFRDRHMLAVQAEIRVPLGGRFAAAGFLGAGEVAHRLTGFRPGGVLLTGGAGARFALDPANRMNLRVDLGVSRFGLAPIVTINEAF